MTTTAVETNQDGAPPSSRSTCIVLLNPFRAGSSLYRRLLCRTTIPAERHHQPSGTFIRKFHPKIFHFILLFLDSNDNRCCFWCQRHGTYDCCLSPIFISTCLSNIIFFVSCSFLIGYRHFHLLEQFFNKLWPSNKLTTASTTFTTEVQ